MAGETLPEVPFESAEALDRWLAVNHSGSGSIWGVFWKKSDPARFIDRQTLLATILRYGWVDSLPRKLDADRTKLLLSPRRRASAWSAVNKTIIERLEAEGRMHPSGAAVVAAARADGSWSKLDEVEAGAVPGDLAAALDATGAARARFEAFPKSARRGILEWIAQAKTPETRARRIAETARLAADNVRALDWKSRRKPPG